MSADACAFVIFAVFISLSVRWKPQLAPDDEVVEQVPVKDKLIAVLQCLPFGLVIFSVMGFILLGVATATEAAASGVAASLVVAAYYRKLKLSMAMESIRSAVEVTCMLMMIIVSSTLYTQLLAFTGASSGLVESVSNLPINALIFICGTLAVAFVMCMFIDQIAFLLLAIPIVQPIMQTYDIEPVYFWMLFVIFMSLGSNTPPFGYNIFTLKAVSSDLELEHIFSAAWKSVGLVLIGVVILLIFPQIITFVPSRM